MLRHQKNTNLTFHLEGNYQGFPVYLRRGPLIKEYLDRTLQVIDSALDEHKRTFAFRVDLRFPADVPLSSRWHNMVIGRFIASFKAKIRHNRKKAKVINIGAHDTSVRYVWCKEIGMHGVPHFHVAILLNNDAYCTLGQFEVGRDNLFNRLVEAWASALSLPVNSAKGLVELPQNPSYRLRRDDLETVADFFYRASYLSKAETKQYGNGGHSFGTSRY